MGCMQVRGALETLVSALTPIAHARGLKNEVQPTLMNADMLSGEMGSISLLLSLLVRFYFILFLCVYVHVCSVPILGGKRIRDLSCGIMEYLS